MIIVLKLPIDRRGEEEEEEEEEQEEVEKDK